LNDGEVIRPPFDGYIAQLVVPLDEPKSRSRAMKLDQNNVSKAQPSSRESDRLRGTNVRENRNTANLRLGANATNSEPIIIGSKDSNDRRTVVSPTQVVGRRSAHNPPFVLPKVFM
jgi:hypothetical protein